MSDHFADDELATLREHGIVLFAGRVIFDAQPPMTVEQISAVQALCAGPIPPELTALWQRTAGGRIDYDLHLRMNGSEEAVSWGELFWNGSDGYHDLQGWIAHEQESAREAAASRGEPWDGLLTALPFGGFEYSDRIYTVVEPGADHGHVLAWKQGLPDAWAHAMHEDGLTTVAHDLPAAFAALRLDEDPLEPAGDYFTGQSLLEFLDERHEDHGLSLELVDKLVAFYRRAVVDWRSPLAEGTLDRDGALSRIALRHAVATDDAALIQRLAAAGVALDGPLQGSAVATDLALSHGAHHAAAALVGAGAPVSPDALDGIDSAISPVLATQLLERGAEPSVAAIAECVACGAPAAARVIADAYRQRHHDLSTAFEKTRQDMLGDLERALADVRTGKVSHYLGAEGLAERVDHLQSFEL
ncbi:SMI1/KNR4 family protein [Variovorax sp. KK3]|uniref:SMI1/KNR4 family protein n=1 Tax=Variovorax sp. KK3 TaxID=1855728 RepID=UPI00097C3AA3|nr:SMI1/KNR4 family protein [Variovorax sp. KK3]